MKGESGKIIQEVLFDFYLKCEQFTRWKRDGREGKNTPKKGNGICKGTEALNTGATWKTTASLVCPEFSVCEKVRWKAEHILAGQLAAGMHRILAPLANASKFVL